MDYAEFLKKLQSQGMLPMSVSRGRRVPWRLKFGIKLHTKSGYSLVIKMGVLIVALLWDSVNPADCYVETGLRVAWIPWNIREAEICPSFTRLLKRKAVEQTHDPH